MMLSKDTELFQDKCNLFHLIRYDSLANSNSFSYFNNSETEKLET